MKFEEWKFIGSIYSLETEKKIAVYNSWQTENARKIFFFYKNQDIRFTVHTDKFPSFKTTHENLCNCYVISHRFFPRFFNRDSNALVTYRRSKRNSIINNSGQSSLVVISRSSIRGVERCSWCCAQHFSLPRVLSPRRETSLHPVCLQRGKLGNSVATIMN